jgi:hypothetical protein
MVPPDEGGIELPRGHLPEVPLHGDKVLKLTQFHSPPGHG